jgi:predicted dehydrogenase
LSTKDTAPECRVAIIGAGYTATEHARAFRDVPGVKLVAIYSRTPARAEQLAAEYGIPAVCHSVAELHEHSHPDLVVVTVGELDMQPVARACFEFPWTVMLEKPAGYRLSAAEAIALAARERNRRVFVALNRRFLFSTLRARAELDAIDGTRFVKVQDQQNLIQAREMGKPAEVVAHWMFANAIHTIDYLRMFGRGRVVRIDPVVAWNPERPGIVVIRMDFESGDIGLYEGVWNGPGPWAVSISTGAHRWEMRPLEQLETQVLGARPVRIDADDRDRDFKPGFRLQAQHAAAAAMGRKSDCVTLDDALETMRLIADMFATHD